jgi:hypothetical protein
MATIRKTTQVHTCDLCGAERPREELSRLGLFGIPEEEPRPQNPVIAGASCDVCVDCQKKHTIAELVETLRREREEHRLERAISPSGGIAPSGDGEAMPEGWTVGTEQAPGDDPDAGYWRYVVAAPGNSRWGVSRYMYRNEDFAWREGAEWARRQAATEDRITDKVIAEHRKGRGWRR